MTSGCTVCVSGFPTELPPQRVVDKLTLHFQRARNGGGEIASIGFAPESPDCVVITFEEAAVAQRILKTDKQVLTVAEKSYPLRVCPYTPGLNPNEIFVRVSMKIDYGRIPGGKEILQNLCKQYAGIVFKFPPQKTSCVATGSFTELQAFSAELLRCFQSKQRDSTAAQNSMPDQNVSLDKRRSACQAGGEGSSLQGAPKAQAEKKNQEATSEGPAPRNPKENCTEPRNPKENCTEPSNPKENCTEPPEDSSLVMDSDVYFYMREFCREELSSILLQHHVGLVDAIGGGIATLYLQMAAQGSEGARALASAHLAISRLSQQLEVTLRKERVSRRDLGGAEGARRLLGELQSLFPQVLCRQDKEYLSVIGNMVEVSQAKQHIQGFIAARNHQKPDVPRAVSMSQMHAKSPVPVQHAPSAASLPRRGSLPGQPSGKPGRKLATRFSASDSTASLPPFSSQDIPLVGLLPGDFSPAAAETRDRSLQGAPTPAAGSGNQAKADSPVTPSGEHLPSSKAWESSRTAMANLLDTECPNSMPSAQTGTLLDTKCPNGTTSAQTGALLVTKCPNGTLSAQTATLLDTKCPNCFALSLHPAPLLPNGSRGAGCWGSGLPPEKALSAASSTHAIVHHHCSRSLLPFGAPSSTSRSLDVPGALRNEDPKISDLGRPNTSLLPKPPNSRDSVAEPPPVAGVNVDHLQPSSRGESICLVQQEAGQRGRGGRKADLQSPTVLAVQRGGGLLTGPPGHICECFSYSRLAVEGPEDKALARLCSTLKACHDSVAVSRGRHQLVLSYPQEAQQQVLETLHVFCAQRLALLTEQLLSQDAQRRKLPEDVSKTEIQRGPQQLRKDSTAGLLERPPRSPGSHARDNVGVPDRCDVSSLQSSQDYVASEIDS